MLSFLLLLLIAVVVVFIKFNLHSIKICNLHFIDLITAYPGTTDNTDNVPIETVEDTQNSTEVALTTAIEPAIMPLILRLVMGSFHMDKNHKDHCL